MAQIKLESLTKHFGDVKAVENLDLVAEHGSFIALLGPSGCGKTTTMNMIAGLEKPTEGEVYFDGHAISHLEPGQRNVGFVFQNYAIFTPHVGVRQSRLRPEGAQAAARRGTRSTARSARSPRPSASPPHSTAARPGSPSTTSRRSRSVARMIVRPAIFLLDEPFSNLDAAFRAYMRAELKRIQHEIGQTMVYVTHDQVEAMGMADRIAVLDLGVLQQYATPDELYNLPENRFVANFIGSVLNNFLPCVYETVGDCATVTVVGGEAKPIDVSERKAAVDGKVETGGRLTASVRPELIRLVPPSAEEATFNAKISLVEPLGAKDVIHMSYDGFDVRAVGVPGSRPTVGENVGLAFDPKRVHLFDDETGLVMR